MGKKSSDAGNLRSLPLLIAALLISCSLAYMAFSFSFRRPNPKILTQSQNLGVGSSAGDSEEECCRGVEHLELWGSAVKWGTDHKFNSSVDCCRACRAMCGGDDGPCLCDSWVFCGDRERCGEKFGEAMCGGDDGPCLCNSWVFCGDRERCGEKFGECWLKKQKDVLFPALQETGEKVIWTSGLIFGKGEGIVGLETDHGTLHIKLMPDCAPYSVSYIVELLGSRHCAGCQFYRAEGRGSSWDSKGNHITDASLGPPYALIQGTLEAEGVPFKKIPTEARPTIRRGSVAWIGSGPEFFISLANHDEWQRAYTVFGSVLPEDMEIAEKIAGLPTRSDVWNSFNVSVLEKPVHLRVRRIRRESEQM